MKQVSFSVVLKAEPEGGYTAIVPSLPGCVTYGKIEEEAKKMASEAIKVYIESLRKHKESIPTENSVLLTVVNVKTGSKFSFA